MNTLKKTLLLAVGLFVLATGAVNAADMSKVEARAMAHEQKWFDLYSKGDAAGVAKLYAQDAILTPPGVAALHGRAAIQAFLVTDIANSKKAGLTLKLGTITGSHESGDTTWISGYWSAVDAGGATVDSGNYLEVSQRTKTGWEITRDIWNSDHPPAAAAPAAK